MRKKWPLQSALRRTWEGIDEVALLKIEIKGRRLAVYHVVALGNLIEVFDLIDSEKNLTKASLELLECLSLLDFLGLLFIKCFLNRVHCPEISVNQQQSLHLIFWGVSIA